MSVAPLELRATASNTTTGATELTVTIPAETQPGDLVIVQLVRSGAGAVRTISGTGWIEYGAQIIGSSVAYRVHWSKNAVSGDAGSVVTLGGAIAGTYQAALVTVWVAAAMRAHSVAGTSLATTAVAHPQVAVASQDVGEIYLLLTAQRQTAATGTPATLSTPANFIRVAHITATNGLGTSNPVAVALTYARRPVGSTDYAAAHATLTASLQVGHASFSASVSPATRKGSLTGEVVINNAPAPLPRAALAADGSIAGQGTRLVGGPAPGELRTSYTFDYESATGVTLTIPQTVRAGDLLMMLYSRAGTSGISVVGGGWTTLLSPLPWSGRSYVMWKAATAADAGKTVQLTTASATVWVGAFAVWAACTGVRGDASGSLGTSTAIPYPSTASVVGDRYVLYGLMRHLDTNTTPVGLTPPTGFDITLYNTFYNSTWTQVLAARTTWSAVIAAKPTWAALMQSAT